MSIGALVAALGNYSVPIKHVGAPVTVRVHRERIVIWRDAERLAEHARAPDGAHRRIVDPAHFAPLFGRKPRGQVMLYREALLGLGAVAQQCLSELSRRQRARLGTEVLAVCALYERCGAAELLAAIELAQAQGAFGASYLGALVSAPVPEPPPPAACLVLPDDVPSQTSGHLDRLIPEDESSSGRDPGSHRSQRPQCRNGRSLSPKYATYGARRLVKSRQRGPRRFQWHRGVPSKRPAGHVRQDFPDGAVDYGHAGVVQDLCLVEYENSTPTDTVTPIPIKPE